MIFLFLLAGNLFSEDKVYEDFEVISSAAKRGNPYYQGLLAEIYRKGQRGQKKDFVKALEWAEKSAGSKNPLGLYNLAVIYEAGLGSKKRLEEAEKLYKAAFDGMKALAEKDDPSAQYDLGYMYLRGKGVEKDRKKALDWISKSAAQGNVHAMYGAGYILLGEQKEQDAQKYFLKAAKKGHVKAQYLVGLYFLKNAPLVKKENPDALLWIGKAAAQGEPDAQYMMGSMYFYGKGVDKDMEKALYWYQRAAAQGHKDAVKRMEAFLKMAKDKGAAIDSKDKKTGPIK